MFRLYWHLRRQKNEVPRMDSQNTKLIILIIIPKTCKLDKDGKIHT